MKEGRTINELAAELHRQNEAKVDYIADTRDLRLDAPLRAVDSDRPSPVVLHAKGVGALGVTRHTHRQIAERVKVPATYYDRMLESAPQLLAVNVNHWFATTPERRMLRTMNGATRAFLSERYRPLDNWDLAQAVLPVLGDVPDMQVVSCEVTEARMYIKAVFPRIQGEVAKGDVVQSGVVISNSEIGMGSLRIEPLVYRLVCLNGMIAATAMKRHHVGGRALFDAEEGGALEFYRDETLKQDDLALWMKVQDTVRSSVSEAAFARVLEDMRASTDVMMQVSPVKVVERVAARYTLNEGEKDNVLLHLLKGGDLSKWGMVNAITRAAQDVESYDRATDLERLGGQVLTLPKTDWRILAEAA